MADFKIFWPLLLRQEGYYADDPNDSGGETWEGIARKKYPDWPGWKIIDSYKGQATFPHVLRLDNTLQAMVIDFYKKSQWDVLEGDQINNQSIANFLADWGVNGGMSVPIKHAEGDLHVTVDGKIGPITITALNAAPQEDLFNELKQERLKFYDDVIKANPKDEVYRENWTTRTNSFSFTA